MLGAPRPPKIFGHNVRCSSSTSPARNKASFNSPPPSQSSRRTPHRSASQRNARRKLISSVPQSSPRPPRRGAAAAFALRPGASSERGSEKTGVETPPPSDPPSRNGSRSHADCIPPGPASSAIADRRRTGPSVTFAPSTVRAPAITASAVALRSSKWSWSRQLPNEDTARLAVAIFPSAVMAMFTRTKGRGAPALERLRPGLRFPNVVLMQSTWHRRS